MLCALFNFNIHPPLAATLGNPAVSLWSHMLVSDDMTNVPKLQACVSFRLHFCWNNKCCTSISVFFASSIIVLLSKSWANTFLTSSSMSLASDDDIQKRRSFWKLFMSSGHWHVNSLQLPLGIYFWIFVNCHYNWFMIISWSNTFQAFLNILKYQFWGFVDDIQN